MRRNVVTAFLSIASGRVLTLLVTALITPLLARILGPGPLGEYATLMAVFGLLMILVSAGINDGARKFLSEERDAPDWKDNVFGYYFRLATVLASVMALLLALVGASGLAADLLGEQYTLYCYLLAGLTMAAQFREYALRSLMGMKREHVYGALKVFHRVVFGVAAVSLALGYDVVGVLVGHIAASLLTAVVAAWFLRGQLRLGAAFERVPDGFPGRELLTFNSMTIVYIFLLTSLYHVDVIMLRGFTTSEQVGYYRVALGLVQFLWIMPKSIQSVMIQSTSDLWSKGKVDRIEAMATRTTRYTMLFTALLAVGLAALAADFVPIYAGADFRPAVLPLLLLLPGTLGFAVARPVLAISHAKGDLRPIIAATGAAALLNLLCNLALIPTFGMAGAAVATTIGYGSLPVFNLLAARRLGYRPFAGSRIVRVGATVAIAAGPIFLLAATIEPPLLALVVVPPVGFVVYALASLLTGAVDVDEVLEVLGALPAPVGPRASRLRERVDDPRERLLAGLVPFRSGGRSE